MKGDRASTNVSMQPTSSMFSLATDCGRHTEKRKHLKYSLINIDFTQLYDSESFENTNN